MRSIKTYNQFNSSDWFGPVQILDINGNEVTTRSGNFINHSPNKITKGQKTNSEDPFYSSINLTWTPDKKG